MFAEVTLTNLLLRGVKSQFNADANRKNTRTALQKWHFFLIQLSSYVFVPGKCSVKSRRAVSTLQLEETKSCRQSLISTEEICARIYLIILTANLLQSDIKLTHVYNNIILIYSLPFIYYFYTLCILLCSYLGINFL